MPVIQVVAGGDTTYPDSGLALNTGQTFDISQGFTPLTVNDDDGTFNGDESVNETPDDLNQTANIGGVDRLIAYDYAFQATYNGVTYTFAVVDVDLNGDGNFGNGFVGGADANENAYYIALIGPSVPDIPPGGATFTVSERVSDNTNSPFNSFVCFTEGTLIDTPRGPVAAQNLQVGDLICTMDHGPRPLVWTGSRRVAARGNLVPVRIGAGVLGNDRDLLVSQQHRVLLSGPQGELLFGEPEVLCPAVSLVGLLPGVALDHGGQGRCRKGGSTGRPAVRYVHLMFDRHEIIFSHGLATESFCPAKRAMASLDDPQRSEILSIFPELANADAAWPLARPVLKRHEVAAFLAA